MHNAAFPLSEVARVFAQQCRQNAIRERAHAQVTQGRCSETLSECSRVGAVFRMAIEELAPARKKKQKNACVEVEKARWLVHGIKGNLSSWKTQWYLRMYRGRTKVTHLAPMHPQVIDLAQAQTHTEEGQSIRGSAQ